MLIRAKFGDGIAESVILHGVTVYHEDEDIGASNESFTAKEVAERLSTVLDLPMQVITIGEKELPDDWNFDQLEIAAIRLWKATNGIKEAKIHHA